MVFSSMHPYLDPANWQQQQQPTYQIGSSSGPGSQLLPPPPPPLPPTQSHGASGSGSIRPGSMADRARMANISMPEAALKCPRCDSTNTKFCYFNNYNLSQPRHFCKTCRRYWTRGGALRNVPVGGGCRRNKRSKGTSSKSPQVSSDRQTGSATSTNSVSSNSASAADMVGLSPHLSSLRFSAPTLHQLTEFGSGEMGLNYGNLSNQMGGVGDLSFQLGTALAGGASSSGSSILSAAGLEQWRMSQTQQFPFLTGLESSPDLYQFQSGAAVPGYGGGASHQLRPKVPTGGITQVASVKMEDHNHHQELNLTRHFLGMNNNSTNHEQYRNTTAGNSNSTAANWTELSGFRYSTTSNNPQ